MAAGDIEVRINSETKAFKMGVERGIIEPLEDAEKALEELGRTRGPEDLERELRQAQKSTEKLADETKDTARQIERSYKDAGRDVGASSKRGFGEAANASKEFKDEALQNFGETAASFDGSMESLGQVATDTLGGVASQLPGIGLAAGAAALGIGGITNRVTELGEKSEEIKNGIIDDFLELGDALDKEAVDARVRDFLSAEPTRKQAELLAEILDVTAGQAVLAMAGDFESAGVTVDEVMAGINQASGNVDFDTWVDLKNTIDSTTDAMKIGEQAAAAQADAQKRTASTTKEAQEEVRDEATKTQQWLQDKLTGEYTVKPSLDMSDVDRGIRGYQPPPILVRGQVVVGTAGVGVRTWQ